MTDFNLTVDGIECNVETSDMGRVVVIRDADGAKIATACESDCGDYWHYNTVTGGAHQIHKDQFVNAQGFCQWLAAISSY